MNGSALLSLFLLFHTLSNFGLSISSSALDISFPGVTLEHLGCSPDPRIPCLNLDTSWGASTVQSSWEWTEDLLRVRVTCSNGCLSGPAYSHLFDTPSSADLLGAKSEQSWDNEAVLLGSHFLLLAPPLEDEVGLLEIDEFTPHLAVGLQYADHPSAGLIMRSGVFEVHATSNVVDLVEFDWLADLSFVRSRLTSSFISCTVGIFSQRDICR